MKLAKAIRGKSLEEVAAIIRGRDPAEIAHLVYTLGNVEPHFSPQTVARMRDLDVQTVRKLIRTGELRPVHKCGDRQGWRIPLSTLRAWDQSTQLPT